MISLSLAIGVRQPTNSLTSESALGRSVGTRVGLTAGASGPHMVSEPA